MTYIFHCRPGAELHITACSAPRSRQKGFLMWTRKELKTRAKTLFKMNYWKAVLAALLLTLLAGGGSSAFSGSGISTFTSRLSSVTPPGNYNYYNTADPDDIYEMIESGNIYDALDAPAPSQMPPAMGLMFAGMFAIIILIVAAIAIAVNILLINPLVVGIRRFFTRNLYEKAQIRELAFGFDHSYKNVIHVMFFRDLHTFLWSLLFLIPGIVKFYEYRMIPYLLAEYPDMPKDDAFAISKYMMSGNKWKAFVLDLSFILWWIGSVFTLGLLGLFYGDPYIAQTGAALYDALKAEKQPFAAQPLPGPQPGSPAGQSFPQAAPMQPGSPAGQSFPQAAPMQPGGITEQPAAPEIDNSAQQDYNEDQ